MEKRIEWFGNRLFPVFPKTVVGRLRSPPASGQDSQNPDPDSSPADIQAPGPQWPGLRLNSENGNIVAQGYGLVVSKDDELKLTPLFKVSQDRLTLKATLFHQDFHGEAIQVKHIEQAVKDLGVQATLDLKSIKRHLKLARKNQSSLPNIPIATGGTPPIEPRDACIELCGDSRYPVFSGDTIGRATEPVQARAGTGIDGTVLEPASCCEPQELSVPDKAGWAFDPQTRTITAKGYGLVTRMDSLIRIKPLFQVSEDRLQLTATIFHRDFLGQAVTMDRMRHELTRAGVKAEIEAQSLSQAIKTASKIREPQASILVASGTPARQGRRADLCLYKNRQAISPEDAAEACIDFHDRRLYHSVQAGELVARTLGPEPGTPGRDIFGHPVPAEADSPLQVRIGENVAVVCNGRPHTLNVQVESGQGPEPDHEEGRPAAQGDTVSDPDLEFYATAPGVVAWDGAILSVSDLLEIKGDVDYSIGNIDLDSGSVHIRGNIQSGFVVQAPGDVLVDGTIEDARVMAGRDCLVKGGIVHDVSGLVQVGGNVQASFAENAAIEADGDVSIDNDMTNCRVTAQGIVRVTAKKGTLQGGTIRCNQGVEANTIGSEHGIKTQIILGAEIRLDPALLKDRERVKDQIARIEAAIGTEDAHVLLSRLSEPRRSKAARLITHKTNLLKKHKELDQQIRHKKDQDLAAAFSAGVTVLKTSHPGTEVRFGGYSLTLTDPLHNGRIFFDPESGTVKTASNAD